MLDELVDALLSRVNQDEEVWAHLRETFEVDLFCGLFLDRLNRGTFLEAETTMMPGRLGLLIGFDIYGHCDCEEE